MTWTDIRENATRDLKLGFKASLENIAIAALVTLPFTFALTLLVNSVVWLPSPVMIGLAGVVQGVGMFWNAGWRNRMKSAGDDQ